MNWTLLFAALKTLKSLIGDERFQHSMDCMFDAAERQIEQSETTIDDMLCMPLIRVLRIILNVPDFPDDGVDLSPETMEKWDPGQLLAAVNAEIAKQGIGGTTISGSGCLPPGDALA